MTEIGWLAVILPDAEMRLAFSISGGNVVGMRLLRPIVILPVILCAACGNTVAPPRPNSASVACEAASAYANIVITKSNGKPVVFASDDQPFNGPIVGGEWWKMEAELPLSAAVAPAALVKGLEAQGNRNAVSRCASVRKLLESHHIGYGSKAVNAVSSPDPSEQFKASIQTVSMPIVSADGQRAVLASSQVSGALAGGGFLQLLERQADGNWKVIAFSPLWIA